MFAKIQPPCINYRAKCLRHSRKKAWQTPSAMHDKKRTQQKRVYRPEHKLFCPEVLKVLRIQFSSIRVALSNVYERFVYCCVILSKNLRKQLCFYLDSICKYRATCLCFSVNVNCWVNSVMHDQMVNHNRYSTFLLF